MTPRLTAQTPGGRPSAPVRIVHLGLGNFFRAHQAWYTEHVADAHEWGIAAFTGRRPDMAEALAPQDGRYTLITKQAEGDSYEVISSVVAVHAASEHEAFLRYMSDPQVAVVTSTVTEFGYQRRSDGHLDEGKAGDDIAALQRDLTAPVTGVPAKLVAGLAARRAAGAGAITVLPCDNLPDNGPAVRTVVVDLARQVDQGLADWICEHVSFATCMVDRITPATTEQHVAEVEEHQGYRDVAPVPTEPFSEWVISGDFPAGRPDWASAGAQIVADVRPYEQRKLLLLNGSHSLLAYGASILGHQTVAEAIADPRCREWVEEWWDVAATTLTLPEQDITDYRQALLDRYANPNIRHLLAQIAYDGSQKLPVRVLGPVKSELAAGRYPAGALRPLAAWVLHLRGLGAPVQDADGAAALQAAEGSLEEAVARVLAFLDLPEDPELVVAVQRLAVELEQLAG